MTWAAPSIGRITTTVFPLAPSERAFRAQPEIPAPFFRDPKNGGLHHVLFPHGSLKRSNPGGRGYGQASKSKSNSAWSCAIRSGGVSQYPTLSSFPGMRAVCLPFIRRILHMNELVDDAHRETELPRNGPVRAPTGPQTHRGLAIRCGGHLPPAPRGAALV